MKTLKVALPQNPYSIYISSLDLEHSVKILHKHLHKKLHTESHTHTIFIVTNRVLEKLYRKKIEQAFKSYKSSFKTVWYVLPDGESMKTLTHCERILLWLSKNGAQRASALLAFGGGVVGDITGFVAATYMRGIDYFQMPTSLLAQVDSSVGGKTGVDLKTGKNLVGAFYQPRAVFIHTDFLKTLPHRELYCGFAEVLKYGVIIDVAFWDYLKHNVKAITALEPKEIAQVIFRCCEIKAGIVARDEKESSVRAILNFGHTLGHAIEVLGAYRKDKHGEAIARGMVFATKLSQKLGFCDVAVIDEVTDVLKQYHLPIQIPDYSRAHYARALGADKKSSGKNIKFILVEKIGKVTIEPLSIRQITKWL